ncbi:MAG: protein-L-isoaspartate(D-aspartate) O-methyltransferase [Acidobacteria bacterium]|nr:protein-L-isoaspartate(D-aspartate) O-methyltransferase [Acidobacteriota bacterium]
MVESQIRARGVENESVLKAMLTVPRHLFVPSGQEDYAYNDHPLSIGYSQTISQPYIVALMTELAEINSDSKVLEIGTGSGYQAAILGEIAKEVYSIEIVKPLYESAGNVLKKLEYKNITLRCGDGYFGWEEHAPFDAIIVTAAPPETPEPLIKQLKIGGKLVVPVGRQWQELIVITREKKGYKKTNAIPVRFVPMTGEAQNK